MIEITTVHEAGLAVKTLILLQTAAQALRELDHDGMADTASDLDYHSKELNEALDRWQAIEDHGSVHKAWRAENPVRPR